MPIYEFVCDKCNNTFSQLCDDIDVADAMCDCGNSAKKILSASNWVFNTSCSNPLNPTEYKQITAVNDLCESRLLWEFYCPVCQHVDERFIYKNEALTQKCDKCGSLMSKYIEANRFELKYNPQTDICDWRS